MKISIHKQSSLEGSVLIVTLIICFILMIALASYLMLIGTQKKLVVRSEMWNAAMTQAEAGAEEALAQLNDSPTNLAANAWSGPNLSIFGPKSNNLIGGVWIPAGVVFRTAFTIRCGRCLTIPKAFSNKASLLAISAHRFSLSASSLL